MSETEMPCPFCQTPMRAGFVWVSHVFAGCLTWAEEEPSLAFWKPSPGEAVFHSTFLNPGKSVRGAFRCPECSTMTIKPDDPN